MTAPRCNENDVVNICRDAAYVAKLVGKINPNSQNNTLSTALLRFADSCHTNIYDQLRSFTKLTLAKSLNGLSDFKADKDIETRNESSDNKLTGSGTQKPPAVFDQNKNENELDKLKGLSIGGFKIDVKHKQQKKRMKPNFVAEKPTTGTTFVPGNINTIDGSKELIDIRTELKHVINTPITQTASTIALFKPPSSSITMETSRNCEECNKHEDIHAAQRMATIYSLFIQHQYIPLMNLLEVLQILMNIDPYIANETVLCTCSQQAKGWNQSTTNGTIDTTGTTTSIKPNVILINGRCIRAFLRCLFEELLPIISNFGQLLVKEIIESSIVRTWIPEIIVKIKERIGISSSTSSNSSSTSSSGIESISFRLPETFIKPFREEYDSKNEFRTQTELGIFYERERIYDELSSLYLRFQTTSRKDLDGSATAAFFRADLPTSGHTILNLRDANYLWLADLFLQQLLYYGTTRSSATTTPILTATTTTTTTTAATSTTAAAAHVSTSPSVDTPTQDNGNSTSRATTSTSMNSINPPPPPPATSAVPAAVLPLPVLPTVTAVRTLPIDTGKQSRLEARLGGGGQVQPSPFSPSAKTSRPRYLTVATNSINNTNSNTSNTTNSTAQASSTVAATTSNININNSTNSNPNTTHKRIYTNTTHATTNRRNVPGAGSAASAHTDNYSEQGLYFSSSQQFFFRFIIIMNNYRFNQCLIDCILAEIEKLSKNDNFTIIQNNNIILENNNEKKELHLYVPCNPNIINNNTTTSNTSSTSSNNSSSSDYFITPENYALKVTKLKILGKFLGLLHFYSRWVPTSAASGSSSSSSNTNNNSSNSNNNNKSSSAIVDNNKNTTTNTTTTTSTDTNKSIHNKLPLSILNQQNTLLKLKLSIYDILMKSRSHRQLALCVPWIVEFMKMLKWEPVVVWLSILLESRNKVEQLHNIPYYDCLIFLYNMQKSADFTLITKNLTGNRMYVLLELQSLWRFLPSSLVSMIYTHPPDIVEAIPRRVRTESREHTPNIEQMMNPTSSGTSSQLGELAYLSGSADLGLDDQDLAFTAVFLHHVLPDMETLYTRMRTARLLRNSGGEQRYRSGVSVGGGRKIKRQTPSIMTAEAMALQVALSNASTAGVRADITVAETGLNSAAVDSLPPAPTTPSKARRAISITSNTTSVSIDSTTAVGAVARSPRKKKSSLSASTSDRTASSGGIEMTAAQARSLRGTPTKNRDRVRTPSFESLSPVQHTYSTTPAVGVNSPHAVLPRETSNKQPQQLPIPSLLESISTSGRSSPATTLFSDRRSVRSLSDLNASFTLRHPSFGSSPMKSTGGAALMMSPLKAGEFGSDRADVLERLEIAFWNQHHNLQSLSNFLLSQTYQACLAHIKERVATAVRELLANIVPLRSENNIHRYEDQVEMHLKRTHYEAICDGDEFINDFYTSFTHNILPKMCQLYPQNSRVVKLAIFFMTRHFHAQKEPLSTHLKVYCLRKLRELSELCTKQQHKQLAELVSNTTNTAGTISTDITTTTTTAAVTTTNVTPTNTTSKNATTTTTQLPNSTPQIAPTTSASKDNSAGHSTSTLTLPDTLAARLCSSLRLLDEHFLLTQTAPSVEKLLVNNNNIMENTIAAVGAVVVLQEECVCIVRTELLTSIDTACKLRNTIASLLGTLLDWVTTLAELFALINTGNKQLSVPTIVSVTMNDATITTANSTDTTTQLELNILHSIHNLNSILTSSIKDIAIAVDTYISTAGLSSTRGSELRGKVSADVAKFLTSALPYLFYLDMVYKSLQFATDQKNITNNRNMKSADTMIPVEVIRMEDSTVITGKNHSLPSDILFPILDHQLINIDILVRILTLTSRMKTGAYFENCRGLTGMKTQLNRLILNFIGRYLSHYQEKYGISFVIREDEEEWYDDSSMRLLVKTALKEGFSSLISSLLVIL